MSEVKETVSEEPAPKDDSSVGQEVPVPEKIEEKLEIKEDDTEDKAEVKEPVKEEEPAVPPKLEEEVKYPEPEEVKKQEEEEITPVDPPPKDDLEESLDEEVVEEEEDEELEEDVEEEDEDIEEEEDEELEEGVSREAGDGEEGDPRDRHLDHDEDRRDPQYIPKRGVFYEHDDRTNEPDVEESEPPPKVEPLKKGKVWKEGAERWSHDKYNDDDQKMKSTQEIVDSYGYDIRCEDGPPKARRRRRYGRGPTKYTRNWEDETAYVKRRGGVVGPLGVGPNRPFRGRSEDFPSLEEGIAPPPRGGRGGRGGPRGRGRGRGRPREFAEDDQPRRRPPPPPQPVQDELPKRKSTAEEDIAALSKQFSNAVINIGEKVVPIQTRSNEPPKTDFRVAMSPGAPLPPMEKKLDKDTDRDGLNDTGSRSKRYSSQRQRSMPPTTGAGGPFVPPQPQPPPIPQPQPPQAAPLPPPPQHFYPQAPPPPYPEVTDPTPAPVPLPPIVAFIPPPPVQPGGYFAPPPPAHYPIPIPPPEVYTGQGGITYYSTQNQVPRPNAPSRRVKLAIPIVPPPENPGQQDAMSS